MSNNYVIQSTDEVDFSLYGIRLTVFVVGLVEFFLLHILMAKKKFNSFLFLKSQPSTQSQLISTNDPKNQDKTKGGDFDGDQSVSEREVETVLRRLGMVRSSEEAKLPSRLDADDLFDIFEETNPSLDEVKEAFDVFDDNRDGFIDATELQKVLCALGLREGLEMENCKKMIKAFDENGDGKIDFDEFVKFMETSLC